MDARHRTFLMRLLPFSHQLYSVPRHRLSNDFVNKFADLIDGLGPDRREHNSELLQLFILLMLYKVPHCKRSKDVKILLRRRLERWEDPSQLAAMVSEAEQVFIHRQSNLQKDLTDDNLAKTYASMCERGDVKKALRWLTDRDGGSVLSPDDIDSKSEKSVEEVLLEKYPPLRDISPSFLED